MPKNILSLWEANCPVSSRKGAIIRGRKKTGSKTYSTDREDEIFSIFQLFFWRIWQTISSHAEELQMADIGEKKIEPVRNYYHTLLARSL